MNNNIARIQIIKIISNGFCTNVVDQEFHVILNTWLTERKLSEEVREFQQKFNTTSNFKKQKTTKGHKTTLHCYLVH